MTGLIPIGSEEKSDSFNPLSDLLVAQFARPADLMPVNLRALTPFQRALLVIDGTVTKFLEAIILQPIDVVPLSQELRSLPEPHKWLELDAGMAVIAREVTLRGRYDDRELHAYAASLLAVERLPDSVRQGCLTTKLGGLGQILLESKLETRREVLWYNRPRADQHRIEELHGRELLSRTYRVVSGGSPLMLINEQFPMPDDLLPSHE